MVWLFDHLAPPWQEAQLAPNTARPALASAGCGWFRVRTVCTHRVIRSSASLAPCVMPWL